MEKFPCGRFPQTQRLLTHKHHHTGPLSLIHLTFRIFPFKFLQIAALVGHKHSGKMETHIFITIHHRMVIRPAIHSCIGPSPSVRPSIQY